MSFYDYKKSLQINREGYPFYAIIMAAMRQADTDNRKKLKEAFPQTWDELWERYNNPGGLSNKELERCEK